MTDWPHLHRSPRHRPRKRRRFAALAALLLFAVAAVAAVAVGAHRGASRSARGGRPHAPVRAVTHPPPPRPDPTVLAVQRVQRTTPYVRVGGPWHRYVALTFDDGPSPYTRELLHVLERRHAPATFFQVGRMIPVFASAARAVEAARYVVGDHTEDHPPMAALGWSGQRAEIMDGMAHMRRVGEPRPLLFRPPYMSYNATTIGLMRRLHMLMVLWTVDSEDYRQPGVGAIVYRVLSGVKPGAIVLMHDGGGPRGETVAAVPLIIDALRRRHFQLVTVPEMMLKDPPVPQQQAPRTGLAAAG
jgi:peptidoglycan-N-acetylglucosamine deacetylase